MEKELFLDLLKQNIQSCSYAFDAITEENNSYRLNEGAASVGFIFRHVGETMLLFGYFFGIPKDAKSSIVSPTCRKINPTLWVFFWHPKRRNEYHDGKARYRTGPRP